MSDEKKIKVHYPPRVYNWLYVLYYMYPLTGTGRQRVREIPAIYCLCMMYILFSKIGNRIKFDNVKRALDDLIALYIPNILYILQNKYTM